LLVSKNNQLCQIVFENRISTYLKNVESIKKEISNDKLDKCLSNSIKQISEYFTNRRKTFNINFHLTLPPFYNKVLNEVRNIPYGEVRTYKEIANKVGNPNAYRAAGTANAKNMLPVIIPCHRVIGKDGDLGGYGGGLKIKKYLLKMEGVI
tara:strand:- start:2386 stop:2838 length:453 start_codon:yes stop_codon:yes gene_type:complete